MSASAQASMPMLRPVRGRQETIPTGLNWVWTFYSAVRPFQAFA